MAEDTKDTKKKEKTKPKKQATPKKVDRKTADVKVAAPAKTKASTNDKGKSVSKKKTKEVAPKIKEKKKVKRAKTRVKHGKPKGVKKVDEKAKSRVKKVIEPKKQAKFIPGAKEVNLYSISGKSSKKIKLPIAFDEGYRLDLIRRAVKSARANRRQPYGPSLSSGMKHSTSTWGKGRGAARVQRLVGARRAVESPNNVGGRRAHPPRADKIWAEKINKKERWKARRTALAAISNNEFVEKRGHKFDKKVTLPVVIEDEFEKIQKTKKALEIFRKIGLYKDLERANNGKHIRSGKGKSRGRIYRRPKSILIIATDQNLIKKGISNLIGVDVVTPSTLSIEDLAPGGDPGRLTIITESALKEMGSW